MYYIFKWDSYYPEGGMNDLVGFYHYKKDAEFAYNKLVSETLETNAGSGIEIQLTDAVGSELHYTFLHNDTIHNTGTGIREIRAKL